MQDSNEGGDGSNTEGDKRADLERRMKEFIGKAFERPRLAGYVDPKAAKGGCCGHPPSCLEAGRCKARDDFEAARKRRPDEPERDRSADFVTPNHMRVRERDRGGLGF